MENDMVRLAIYVFLLLFHNMALSPTVSEIKGDILRKKLHPLYLTPPLRGPLGIL